MHVYVHKCTINTFTSINYSNISLSNELYILSSLVKLGASITHITKEIAKHVRYTQKKEALIV